ncbi:MAG TPA: MucR family transcriptional regulator [Sphingobium sp.]|uniref:MucR family transcriptional regulator n=1 Tax=Sphingobium sp. TaxID=1912891 RepID=UPI002ED41428
MAETEQTDVAALTVQLLSAYLSNNTVAHTDLADLVRSTKAALIESEAPAPVEPEIQAVVPAVSVRKSLASPDHILSLIDGKPYKTLKRHLTSHGLTPENYRARYGLPSSYPMVAPGFAAQRREIAARIGLGRLPKTTGGAKVSKPAVIEAAVTAAPATKQVASAPKATKVPAVQAAKGKVATKPTGLKKTVVSSKDAEPAAASPEAIATAPASAKGAPASKRVQSKAKTAPVAVTASKAASRARSIKAIKPNPVAKSAIARAEASIEPVIAKTVTQPSATASSKKAPIKRVDTVDKTNIHVEGKSSAKSPPAADASGAPKTKSRRDKLSLFREVAEQSRARADAKTAPAKAIKPKPIKAAPAASENPSELPLPSTSEA